MTVTNLFPVVSVECRTVAREHIPKKHLDFENPIRGKPVERTSDRIYGEYISF